MKRLLLFLGLFSTSMLVSQASLSKKIDSVEIIYADAVEFMLQAEARADVKPTDLFDFFAKFNLSSKKNVKKLQSTARKLYKLASMKKHKDNARLQKWADQLKKLDKFVKEQRHVFYVLSTSQEIAYFYRNFDCHRSDLASMLANNPGLFGIKSKRHSLYVLVKKIELDLRRIKHLFAHYKIGNDLAVELNVLKTKLADLKELIVDSSIYKKQRKKMRFFKALGVILIAPVLCALSWFVAAIVIENYAMLLTFDPLMTVIVAGSVGAFLLTKTVITAKELGQAVKYDIPVHSSSLFSWFAPPLFPLTWVARG